MFCISVPLKKEVLIKQLENFEFLRLMAMASHADNKCQVPKIYVFYKTTTADSMVTINGY